MSPDPSSPLAVRWLAPSVLVLTLLGGACGPPTDGATPATSASPPAPATPAQDATAPTPTTTAAPAPTTAATAPARPSPWRPGDDEVLPAAKQLAAEVVETLTTYDVGEAAGVLDQVASDAALRDATAAAAAPLLHPDRWSRGRVTYAQLGGYRDEGASVMVVVEQRTARPPEDVEVTTRTVDVRLVRTDGRWGFAALASVGGDPVPRPDDLPTEAVAVLDDPRIDLPDSARWDIHAGLVHPDLLRVMAQIAERTPYGVVTITNGHPRHVFGTEHLSDHTDGRAVDIAILDGTPVAASRAEGSPALELTRWLWTHPDVRQVGSPWALDGYGGRSFTDVVHQDHLHVAVAGHSASPDDARPSGTEAASSGSDG